PREQRHGLHLGNAPDPASPGCPSLTVVAPEEAFRHFRIRGGPGGVVSADGRDRPGCPDRGGPGNTVQTGANRYRRSGVQGLEISVTATRRRNRIGDKLEYFP